MTSLRIKVVDDYGAYIQFGVGHHGNALAQVTGPYRIQSVEYRRARRCSRTSASRAPTAASAPRSTTGCSSGSSTWPRRSSASTRSRSAAGTSSARTSSRTTSRPATSTTPATTRPCSTRRSSCADLDHWRAEQAKAREEGRYIGIGLVTCQERSVFSADRVLVLVRRAGRARDVDARERALSVDAARRLHGDAVLAARSGATAPRRWSRSSWPRSSASSPHDVSVVYAGTRNGLPATGPGGSRMTVMLAGAVEGAAAQASRTRRQGRRAHARGRAGRPRVGRRRRPGQGLAGAAQVARRHRDPDAPVQARPARGASSSGLEARTRLRPPVHDDAVAPTARTSASSIRSWATPATSRWSRSTSQTGRGDVPRVHRRPRLRDARQPALARAATSPAARAGDRHGAATSSTSTTPTASLLTASFMDYLIPTAMEVPSS